MKRFGTYSLLPQLGSLSSRVVLIQLRLTTWPREAPEEDSRGISSSADRRKELYKAEVSWAWFQCLFAVLGQARQSSFFFLFVCFVAVLLKVCKALQHNGPGKLELSPASKSHRKGQITSKENCDLGLKSCRCLHALAHAFMIWLLYASCLCTDSLMQPSELSVNHFTKTLNKPRKYRFLFKMPSLYN